MELRRSTFLLDRVSGRNTKQGCQPLNREFSYELYNFVFGVYPIAPCYCWPMLTHMTHFLQTTALPTQQDRILSHKEHKQLKTQPHVTRLSCLYSVGSQGVLCYFIRQSCHSCMKRQQQSENHTNRLLTTRYPIWRVPFLWNVTPPNDSSASDFSSRRRSVIFKGRNAQDVIPQKKETLSHIAGKTKKLQNSQI